MSGRGGAEGSGREPDAKPRTKREPSAAKADRERQARPSRLGARGQRAAIAIALIAGGTVFALGLVRDQEPSGVAVAGDLRKGGTIEELRLPELEGDGTVEYEMYADRPLVINFFASWCPSCIGEMPEFERVLGLLGEKVAFLGVSQSDPRNASIDLARSTGITYDTAFDARGEFFRAAGGMGMPTTIFVRPGGEIAEVWVGALSADALQQLVADHFGIES